MTRRYILIALFSWLCNGSFGQTLPVGSKREDLYRRKQLLEEVPATSFSIRPVETTALNREDSIVTANGFSPGIVPFSFAKGRGLVKLLPLTWDQQLNSHHPYGWNDGAMIPAKGYQTAVSAGIYARLWILHIQLQPEFVYAANRDYVKENDAFNAPKGAYSKIFLGQSSLSLRYGPMALSFSNENLWWGPGVQNSIMMTNNAPGFKHLTFNTTRPVKTLIGAFEGQVIGGRLDNSTSDPVNYNDDWRYLAGLNLNYQPKWITGLYLGFSRTFMSYKEDVNGFADYFPFFTRLQKFTGDQDKFPRDQRISLYARWLFQKAHSEVYFEYGLNDNAFNFRDFLGAPDHGRSYLFGFTKLVTLKKPDEYIRINLEVTQMSQALDRIVREAGSFYLHSQVRQGYTNQSQILGAGTGNGSNLQGLQIDWINGYKKLGISLQRLEHNMDFYNASVRDLNGLSRKWVDFAVGVNGQWNYKNFILNAKFQGIQSLNYQWYMKDYTPGQYYIPHNDILNFHGELGVMYRF